MSDLNKQASNNKLSTTPPVRKGLLSTIATQATKAYDLLWNKGQRPALPKINQDLLVPGEHKPLSNTTPQTLKELKKQQQEQKAAALKAKTAAATETAMNNTTKDTTTPSDSEEKSKKNSADIIRLVHKKQERITDSKIKPILHHTNGPSHTIEKNDRLDEKGIENVGLRIHEEMRKADTIEKLFTLITKDFWQEIKKLESGESSPENSGKTIEIIGKEGVKLTIAINEERLGDFAYVGLAIKKHSNFIVTDGALLQNNVKNHYGRRINFGTIMQIEIACHMAKDALGFTFAGRNRYKELIEAQIDKLGECCIEKIQEIQAEKVRNFIDDRTGLQNNKVYLAYINRLEESGEKYQEYNFEVDPESEHVIELGNEGKIALMCNMAHQCKQMDTNNFFINRENVIIYIETTKNASEAKNIKIEEIIKRMNTSKRTGLPAKNILAYMVDQESKR